MYETGGIAVVLAAGVSAGIDYVRGLGIDKIRSHARVLTDRLQAELPPLGYLPLTPRGNPDADRRVRPQGRRGDEQDAAGREDRRHGRGQREPAAAVGLGVQHPRGHRPRRRGTRRPPDEPRPRLMPSRGSPTVPYVVLPPTRERPRGDAHPARARRAARGPAAVCSPRWPTRSASRRAHYRKHIELFPEGQFVVLDGDRVVGGHRDHPPALRLRSRQPHLRRDHPGRLADLARARRRLAVRRRHRRASRTIAAAGSAQALYAARQELVWALGLQGPGDGRHDERLRRGQGHG